MGGGFMEGETLYGGGNTSWGGETLHGGKHFMGGGNTSWGGETLHGGGGETLHGEGETLHGGGGNTSWGGGNTSWGGGGNTSWGGGNTSWGGGGGSWAGVIMSGNRKKILPLKYIDSRCKVCTTCALHKVYTSHTDCVHVEVKYVHRRTD